MQFSDAIAAGTLVLSLIALVYSRIAFRRTVTKDRTRHIKAVSLFSEWIVGEPTRDNHPHLVVRNDGDTAVEIAGLGIAYGDWYVTNRNEPSRWSLVAEGEMALLRPGAEYRVPEPDLITSGPAIIGPSVYVTDANGYVWQKVPGRHIFQQHKWRRPSRREQWFERQPWWPKLDARLSNCAAERIAARPGRFPLLAILVHAAWGWRPEPPTRSGLPLNAPLAWRYNKYRYSGPPEIDSTPHYSWRDDTKTRHE